MKSILGVAVGFIMVFVGCIAHGQTKDFVENQAEVDIASTFILVGRQQWSMQELNALCLARLKKEPDWPKDAKFNVVVNITPQDKATMCNFGFYREFGKSSWFVEISYDGKVGKVTKQTIREGRPKRVEADR